MHLLCTGSTDVSKIDDVLPAKPAKNLFDLGFRIGVVSRNEHVVRARNKGRIDHRCGSNRIQRLHHFGRWERPLYELSQGVGVADGKSRRRASRKIERIGDIDHYLAVEIPGASCVEGFARACAGGAVEYDVSVLGGFGESSLRRFATDFPHPRARLFTARSARPHSHVVTQLHELGRNRLSDHASSKDSDFHVSVKICLRVNQYFSPPASANSFIILSCSSDSFSGTAIETSTIRSPLFSPF